jgi:hypothetical protein
VVDLRLGGVVVIVGNYGSGKSEVAINLAAYHRQIGLQVRIADLDLVNPYFRSREARVALAELGIEVVLPPDAYLHAELPVLSPMVAGIIRRPGELTILDVGGDNVGAMVLAALGDAFAAGAIPQMLQVVNPLRPATGTHAGCLKIRREIEAAAGLSVTGLIGNRQPDRRDHTGRDHRRLRVRAGVVGGERAAGRVHHRGRGIAAAGGCHAVCLPAAHDPPAACAAVEEGRSAVTAGFSPAGNEQRHSGSNGGPVRTFRRN